MDQLTAKVAQALGTIVALKLELHDQDVKFGDWSDRELADRYRGKLAGTAGWAADEGKVICQSGDASMAADILDRAASDFDLPETAEIRTEGQGVAILTW